MSEEEKPLLVRSWKRSYSILVAEQDERTGDVMKAGNAPHKQQHGDPNTDPGRVPVHKSFRKWIVVVSTMSMINVFATQSSMSSALVCMIPGEVDDHPGGHLTNHSTPWPDSDSDSDGDSKWVFHWDKTSQGWALSSLFIGYYVSQLPSGIASTRFGNKNVLVVGLFLNGAIQFLTVPAAFYGLPYLYATRAMAGLMVGFMYAPTFALVGQWIPRQEMSLMFGIVGSGMELGNMLSFLISTFACEIDFQNGWPIIFYILSACNLVTACLMAVFMSDSPFANKFISAKEKKYIAGSVPKPNTDKAKALGKIPVKAILKSMPVWAIVVSQLGGDWMYYFMVTMIPLYLKEVIKLPEVQVNLLSGVPYIFILPTIYLAGFVTDKLTTRGTISLTKMRKVNDFFTKMIPAVALASLGFVPEGSRSVGVVFVLNSLTAAFMAFSYVSWMTSPVDIAGGHTAFVVGLCESLVMWVGVVIPLVTEAITHDKTREQWQMVFFITSGLQVVTYIFYAIFASGELQPWARSTFQYTLDDVDDEEGDGQLGPKGKSDSVGLSNKSGTHSLIESEASDSRADGGHQIRNFSGKRFESDTNPQRETSLTGAKGDSMPLDSGHIDNSGLSVDTVHTDRRAPLKRCDAYDDGVDEETPLITK